MPDITQDQFYKMVLEDDKQALEILTLKCEIHNLRRQIHELISLINRAQAAAVKIEDESNERESVK